MRDMQHEMEVVFEHYDLHLPTGSGDRRVTCPSASHDDRHASASVNASKGLWTCFACERGGSAVDLVMDREGVSYADARGIIDGLLGGGGSAVPTEPGLFSSRAVPGKQRDQRNRKAYRPTWLGDR